MKSTFSPCAQNYNLKKKSKIKINKNKKTNDIVENNQREQRDKIHQKFRPFQCSLSDYFQKKNANK